ncbi:DUF167 family protein [Brevibacillus migulae]|uniref:DUF167 family protein n=1 Tax=Brevibacillus migulae TaxID=1644114 RepID=UPI00106E245F|nr:DUF167 family protein [Brevibacillus migulae]
MKLTVRKAEGPGWLLIAEIVEEGKYKMVQERCAKEPQYELIMQFIHRLPRLLDQVAGVEAEEAYKPAVLSAKRAARLASREMERSRIRQAPGKSVILKAAEWEDASRIIREVIEVTVWIKPGKKRTMLRDISSNETLVIDVAAGHLGKQANEAVMNVLKKHYGVYERDIELLDGYNGQQKRFRITKRKRL